MATDSETVNLWQFEAQVSDDEVKTDLELTCMLCKQVICDIEHGDTIGTLVSVVGDHTCETTADEHGLVGAQRERYAALVDHVGHDDALADAREWPEVEE